jgi:hypothetical protein
MSMSRISSRCLASSETGAASAVPGDGAGVADGPARLNRRRGAAEVERSRRQAKLPAGATRRDRRRRRLADAGRHPGEGRVEADARQRLRRQFLERLADLVG